MPHLAAALRRFRLLPVLLLVAVAACEPSTHPAAPRPAEEADELLGGLLGGSQVQGLTLIKDPLLPGLVGSLGTSSLIGLQGGQISLLGHSVLVPQGAVTQPTLFSLLVLPTGYVEVDLSATVTSLLGLVVDVGSRGFETPVPVTLSYARGTNVSDPSKLKVVRINSILGYKYYEILPTQVDPVAKTVTSDLEHFSRYVVAVPN